MEVLYILPLKDRIEVAKTKLGKTAFEIMAKEIPLECVSIENGTCKSPFKEEKTPSAHWYDKGNCLHCFATGLNMDYIDYLMKYRGLTFKESVSELFVLVGEEVDENDFTKQEGITDKFRHSKKEPVNDRKNVELYMSKRGISIPTLDYCDVDQNPSGDVAFQFMDIDNQLVQTKYRVSRPAKNGEFKWYWQKDTDNCALLYGVNKVNTSQPLVICEGLSDRLAIVESGFCNCVSIPGGAHDENWIDFNFELLEKCNDIILWFDDDEAGKSAVKDCANRIGIYKTRIVQSDADVKNSIRDYYRGFGQDIDKIDANNVLVSCGKECVLSMIKLAKQVEDKKIKKLFTYDEIELQNLPYVSTGFKSLDKIVYGNFDGTLIILTGFAGSGKSTLISEMGIIAPVESGRKVMIYSGETNGGLLEGNTLRPFAGRNHILEYDNSARGVPNGYVVTNKAKEKIKEYYMDSVYNYDDEDGLSSSSDDILQSMEYAYRRYGVTFFTLDNLMTIVTCDRDDEKYSSQIKFSKRLKGFTRKYPVTVILVAHPKKPVAGQQDVDMYGVSGSSEIVNLADRAYSVGTIRDDPEGYNSYITILKDRQTGHSNKKVKMFYDGVSSRIYSDQQELGKTYSWEKDFVPNYNDWESRMLYKNHQHNQEASEVLGVIE